MSSSPHDRLPRSLTILYATETGNAQEISDRVARQCRRIHLDAIVHSMNAYAPSDLISENRVVFVVSTTGTGKEPRAMTPLWNMLLRADLPEDLFEDLAFAVFGLGDSAYEKFCWPAKLLARRLESLGATEICARGEGDDQHPLGVDGAFEPWIAKLEDVLLAMYPLPPDVVIPPADSLPPPRISLSDADGPSSSALKDPLALDRRYNTATMSCNRRITAEDWYQDVRHFEFDFEEDVRYEPGDVLVIHPEAAAMDVDTVLVTLGFANVADDPFTITHALLDQSLPDHLPHRTTLRALFTRYLDIGAVPRRSFFALLRHFVTDELEREKLEEFLSAEGADEMYEYCQRPRRTIREVLDEFRSARVPREYVFDLFPPLRSREFSIASSVKRHPRQVHLCVAIVHYRTMLKVPRRGVCTSYLARLRVGDTLRVGIQKGLLALPEDARTPVICVGPGTGVAPMRALIEERVFAGSTENTLYFGCRSAKKDQHYHRELEAHAQQGELTYRVACSRDGPPGVARTYVQDLIREDALRVWGLLVRGAWVYISGSSNKMPAGVRGALRDVVRMEGGKGEEEAREYVGAMEREGRLIEECWS
ncbi:NADPH-dependent diflavin oxidoreductase 1 [Sparassis crispa]|uniref:NADPH-dependent diflavin oxidoreductase 1 n=1 Tax=Sparassis crispa TaxID=139825 RepID=A0A401GYR3_9APHY|nr:NADPH-dependent diflavin oxidoreductase 1 [Sparassis crispa]GBE87307.1 NADPH-dependent diflavin oxidoreductase 1 [Sparassis crispa]